MRNLVLLKKALAAAALLSISVTSVGAYAASAALNRASSPARKVNKDGGVSIALYLLGAAAVGGGMVPALDDGGSKSP